MTISPESQMEKLRPRETVGSLCISRLGPNLLSADVLGLLSLRYSPALMAEIIRLLGRYLDQNYLEKQEFLQFPKAVLSLSLGKLQTQHRCSDRKCGRGISFMKLLELPDSQPSA